MMGFVRVPVKVFAYENGKSVDEVSALADTGAIYSVFPRRVLEAAGVKPSRKGRFRTTEGRPMEREVGNVEIEVVGRRSIGMVPVIFGEEGDKVVLGVTALELMGLEVDPANGELRPTEMLLLRLAPDFGTT